MGDTQSLLLAILAVCSGGSVLAVSSQPAPTGRADTVREFIPPPRAAESAASPSAITINRSSDRMFYVDATVNGRTVRFLVDTGANLTLLAPDDAALAGVSGSSSVALETAGGNTSIAAGRIDGMTIGGHQLHPLKVGIPGSLKTSLLGQDALAELGTLTFSGNAMTIHLPKRADGAD